MLESSWRPILVNLLLLSSNGIAQSGHDSTTTAPLLDRSGDATTATPSATLKSSTWNSSLQGNATCPSRTANYITHTLPQQCLRTNRSAVGNDTESSTGLSANGTNPAISSTIAESSSTIPSTTVASDGAASTISQSVETTASQSSPLISPVVAATTSEPIVPSVAPSETEAEDSPLDNANFLSFEEWKKQNLAKAGQSPENLAGRAQPMNGERRRPGINNALDTLGEENEIELDFSGFGGGFDTGSQKPSSESGQIAAVPSSPAQQAHRSKDAGKTCKERTNYASFDCAATILKNNPEGKSGSSVLVENKDSYMLNKCSADNKFIIIELCDDILLDTIVLANYEFFSSIFRHFRISVSDRYPVKTEKWKTLGTFEARNTREVQAFLIENPLIWARYLRIEFLTHYGNEYFCPVSLLRVHGTTMMDEFRHQEELARGDAQDDDAVLEPEVPAAVAVAQEPAEASPVIEDETAQVIPTADVDTKSTSSHAAPSIPDAINLDSSETIAPELLNTDPVSRLDEFLANTTCATATSDNSTLLESDHGPTTLKSSPIVSTHDTASVALTPKDVVGPSQGTVSKSNETKLVSDPTSVTESMKASMIYTAPGKHSVSVTDVRAASPSTTTAPLSISGAPPPSRSHNETVSQPSSRSGSSNTSTNSTRPASSTAPQPAQPSTQESFFKSVHKRLQQLESNSTLSLQYIEEQSRILRDAFTKVEKRQVAATTNFLTHVNETIMTELHGFRQAYDQLWQSTVLELEGQREQYQREMLALSTRLTLIADELVWQKRMGIVQSTLLLLCLGLVLFNRAGNSALDMPLVQQMMHKSQAAFRAGFESPPNSPSPNSRSPVSLFRRKLWRNSEPASGHVTDEVESRPPSQGGPSVHLEPPTPDAVSEDDDDSGEGEWKEVPEVQSGPTTPSGLRDENGPPIWPEEAVTTEGTAQLVP